METPEQSVKSVQISQSVKTPERRQRRRSGVFIVNFEQISHIVLVSLLLYLNK